MRVVYTLKARQDLQEIYEYIAYTLLVPDTAQNLTETIMAKIRKLDLMPDGNPLYHEEPWHSLGVRFMPVKNYLVFYVVDHERNVVSISRIMYGGRDVSSQLRDTTEW